MWGQTDFLRAIRYSTFACPFQHPSSFGTCLYKSPHFAGKQSRLYAFFLSSSFSKEHTPAVVKQMLTHHMLLFIFFWPEHRWGNTYSAGSASALVGVKVQLSQRLFKTLLGKTASSGGGIMKLHVAICLTLARQANGSYVPNSTYCQTQDSKYYYIGNCCFSHLSFYIVNYDLHLFDGIASPFSLTSRKHETSFEFFCFNECNRGSLRLPYSLHLVPKWNS